VPIVPVIVRGSAEIQRPGSLRVHPGEIHVHFGEPLRPDEFGPGDTEAVMTAIRARMEAMLEENRSAESRPAP